MCVFLFSSYSGRFTAIAVDPQVQTPQNKYYDVLYIGTGQSNPIVGINFKKVRVCLVFIVGV